MSKIMVDIVIPGWNFSEMMVKCLKSIKKHTRSYRVIYVDNGSEPAELEKIMDVLQDMPHLLIANEKNLGFIKATNAGIKASEAPYIILMNNDTEAVKGWISKLKKPIDEHEKVVISGPLTTTPDSWQGKWPKGQTGYVIREIGMLAFFCVMIKRDIFNQVGLLSESFGVGFADDDEFCNRILDAGYKMALIQDLVIPHHHRTTFKKIYSEQEITAMQKINLRKFKEKKYDYGLSGNVDVVYILGRGSTWGDNEIRYSIRSFKKYFKDLRHVIVVGELPFFLRGVTHIPYTDKQEFNKDAKMMLKIRAACKDERVSDNFVFCTDDTLLLHSLSFSDFTGWHDGPIMYNVSADMEDHRKEVLNPKPRATSEWFSYVYKTGEELKKRGFTDNNYDRAHCPQPVNKNEFLEVMAQWDMANNNYTVSNIYNNSSKLFKGENIAGKNLKIYGPAETVKQLTELTQNRYCLNYNNAGLNNTLKDFLQLQFPEPTEYETFITSTDRRTAVEAWFKNGCDYDEGVGIFQQFAPRNRLLLRFFQIKKEHPLGMIKLKGTLRLWMR